jgi:FAD synthetase
MGVRRTDPHSSNLKYFSSTDESWPSFMRINPILEWDLDNIWNYIKLLNIPYCILYDRGYTSIGNMDDTLPNDCLRNSEMQSGFSPAYSFYDTNNERFGRIKR